jgi:hypothetical protein
MLAAIERQVDVVQEQARVAKRLAVLLRLLSEIRLPSGRGGIHQVQVHRPGAACFLPGSRGVQPRARRIVEEVVLVGVQRRAEIARDAAGVVRVVEIAATRAARVGPVGGTGRLVGHQVLEHGPAEAGRAHVVAVRLVAAREHEGREILDERLKGRAVLGWVVEHRQPRG